jgi:hypothetical protein
MADWTQAQRVKIREYLGAGNLFLQRWPRVESAIDSIRATADGGTQPDNSAQLEVIAILARLAVYEATIDDLLTTPDIMKAEEVGLDPARGLVTVRMQARSLCSRMATMLGMDGVLADAFAPGRIASDIENAFSRHGA